MRVSDLKEKEVVNICDCKRLGYVGDIDFDECTGCVKAFIVPGPGCFCGFLGREKEYVIPYKCVKQIGKDIILVEVQTKEVEKSCKI